MGPIDMASSDATTPGQSGHCSNGNEGIFHIPQSSKAGALPSDGLMSFPGHLLEGSCRYAVGVFYSPKQLGYANRSIDFNGMSTHLGYFIPRG